MARQAKRRPKLGSFVSLTVAAIVGAGCASAAGDRERFGDKLLRMSDPKGPPEPEVPSTYKLPDKREQRVDIERLAASMDDPVDCERQASQLLLGDAAGAWALLKLCVRRLGYNDLGRLLEPGWRDVIRENWVRGARLLSFVIVRRGAHLALDIKRTKQAGLPLRSLSEAMDLPDENRNKLVLMRAVVVDMRNDGKGAALDLAETTLKPDDYDELRHRRRARSARRRRPRKPPDPAKRKWGTAHAAEAQDAAPATETGRDVFAKMSWRDNKLALDSEYLLLVRFIGLRPPPGDAGFVDDAAVVRVVSYYDPGEPTIF